MIQFHFLGWKKIAVRGRVWDVSQCLNLGEKQITDGIKTEGKACKGYCNDLGSKRCNAINWNPWTNICIAWSCGTPTPLPIGLLPGFETYAREEKGTELDLKKLTFIELCYTSKYKYEV